MKKYYSVAAWKVDFDAIPDIYVVIAESKEEAKEKVAKQYKESEIDVIEIHGEIDLSLPMQKVFPCWWDHIDTE
jgi:hypothetical protein